MVSDVFGNVVVDTGRQGQVKEPVGLGSAGLRQQMCVELGEGTFVCVRPTDVGVPAEEHRQPFRLRVFHLGQGGER